MAAKMGVSIIRRLNRMGALIEKTLAPQQVKQKRDYGF